MKVRDFSEQIVEVARNNNGNPPDYAGPLLSLFTIEVTYQFTKIVPDNIVFQASGPVFGVTSFLALAFSEKYNNSKLTKYSQDSRFETYGLNDHYNINQLVSRYPKIRKPTLKKPNISNLIQRPINVTEKTKKTFSAAKDKLSYVIHNPKEVFSKIKKSSKETFSAVKDSVTYVVNNPRKTKEHAVKTVKEMYNNMHRDIAPTIRGCWVSGQLAFGFFIPPITYGSLTGIFIDHFNKSGKVKEIRNAIQIGSEIENMIDQDVPKEEIERFLEGLK